MPGFLLKKDNRPSAGGVFSNIQRWIPFALVVILIAISSSSLFAQSALDGFDPGADNAVHSMAVQTDGKILVGGLFTNLAGQVRSRLGRLNVDGSLDNTFTNGANAWVRSVVVQADGKILVGGDFTTLAGQSRNYIGRLNADGSIDNTFTNGANSAVSSIAVQSDGKIVIGGAFTTLVGQPRNYIGRLNADGSIDNTFTNGANNAIWSVVLQSDDKVVVGGQFTNLAGQARSRIGRFHADGSLDNTFTNGANSEVYALVVQEDDKIILSGLFTDLAGQARGRIGRLNVDGSLDNTFTNGANNQVVSLALQPDGKILVGGDFTTLAGQTRNRIGRFNVNGSLDNTFTNGANGFVWSMAVQPDGNILAGGSFSNLAGQARDNIGRLYPDGSLDTTLTNGASSGILSLVQQSDGRMLVGGGFTNFAGQARSEIGRLYLDGSLDNTFTNGASGGVLCLAQQPNGKILVGGEFTNLAGQAQNYIGRLNEDGSLDNTFTNDANGWVYSLALQSDGKILVGGFFTTLAGQARSRIGRLNADGSLDNTFTNGADSFVLSLAQQPDGKILVGGSFDTLAGQARSKIGRLNEDGSLDNTFTNGVSGQVTSLALQTDGKILVGGSFTTLAGQARNYMGRLNKDSSLDNTFTNGASSSVSISLQSDGKILVGGNFSTLAGQTRNNIGRLTTPDAAIQLLTAGKGGTSAIWQRSGSGPEVWRTTLESSTNGTSWNTNIVSGIRTTNGWEFTGLSLPINELGWLRARGYATGGFQNGSHSIIESVKMFYLHPHPVLYVDASASGADDGTTWANAFTNLQDALTAAVTNDQIWVSAGTYKPTTTTNRIISFQMKDGVDMYGGFSGGETNVNMRDWNTKATILSGDIPGANSVHVLRGGNATIDGFVIANGYGDSVATFHGAGMLNSNVTAVVRNCTFTENIAESGGAIYSDGGVTTIENSFFIGNRCSVFSSGYGGAIHTVNGDLHVISSVFSGNHATEDGGAIYQNGGISRLMNCQINGNDASTHGGGIYLVNNAEMSLESSTIAHNIGDVRGGGIYVGSGHCDLTNSILWSSYSSIGPEMYIDNGTATVTYCNIQGGIAGIVNTNGGLVVTNSGNINFDPQFINQVTGTWTSASVYDTNTLQTLLTDSSASWQPDEMAGKYIYATTNETPFTLHNERRIVSNTTTSITIWGNLNIVSTNAVTNGSTYAIYDYHLQSTAGHWESGLNIWSNDVANSPCIDAGDPAFTFANETVPNGGRINMGAYGNTPEASKSVDINSGLVAYYPFNGNANDASGNGHHGTPDSVTWGSDYTGTTNASGEFISSGIAGSEIVIPDHDDLDLTESFSICAWIRADSPDWNDSILTKHESETSAADEWGFYLQTTGALSTCAFNTIADGGFFTQPFDATVWRHIACSYDKTGSVLELYVDGQASGVFTGLVLNIANTTVAMEIGGEAGTHYRTPNWNGGLDEVRIYNRALSSNEVMQLADADSDGISDAWEVKWFGNLSQDGTGDWDGDGLLDQFEFTSGANPTTNDTDSDAFSDYIEFINGTVLTNGTLFPSFPYKEWTRIWGSVTNEEGSPIGVDLSGNTYVACRTEGEFDGQTNSGGAFDFGLSKHSPDGTRLWSRIWGTGGEKGIAVSVDNSDNSYVGGYASGDFDGQTNAGAWDMSLTKHDPSGTRLWYRMWGSTSSDIAKSIEVDSSNNIYVAGSAGDAFDGQTNAGGLCLTRFDDSGNKQWTRIWGDGSADGLSIDNAGDIYASGNAYSSFGGQPFLGNSDLSLTKYSADGSNLWVRLWGSTNNDAGVECATDVSNNIYVVGYTAGAFDGETNSGGDDLCLTKYDAGGTKKWTRIWGSVNNDRAEGVTIDDQGDIYVAGTTDGPFDGQPHAGGNRLCLSKFDPAGNRQWSRIWGSGNESGSRTRTVVSGGEIYVSSGTSGEFDGALNTGVEADLCLTKWIDAPPPTNLPVINNDIGAINVTNNFATLNCNLISDGGSSSEVRVYWGLTDEGTSFTWDNMESLGLKSPGVYNTNITALLPNTNYFYRAYATNANGDAWAPATTNFMTTGGGGGNLPIVALNPPAVLSETEAILFGNLISTGAAPTEVWAYWGETNQTTNASMWADSSYMGFKDFGTLSNYVGTLTSNTQYYYTFQASNSFGDAWSPVTNFMTPDGVGGPHIYYRFDGNLFDDSPNTYDLTPTGAPTHPAGVINQSVSISFADYATVSGISNPESLQTLDTWVSISDTNSLQHIVDLNDGSLNNSMQLVYDDVGDALRWRLRLGGSNAWEGSFFGVTPFSYYHVVGTCGPLGASLHVDGNPIWSSGDTSIPIGSMDSLSVGADALGGNDMNGEVDNLAFFDFPYNTNDVMNSYNGGSGMEFGGPSGSNVKVHVMMDHIGIVGAPMSYTIEVYKDDGSLASNFVGAVDFDSDDFGATYSSSFNFTGSEGGTYTMTNDLTFSGTGFWMFEAFPQGEPWKGSSTDVQVFNGGGTNTTHFFIDAHPRPIIHSMWHDLAIVALDDNDQINTSHSTPVTFSSSAGGATFATSPFSSLSNGWAVIPDQMLLTTPSEQAIRVTSQADTNAWGETKVMVFGGGTIYYVSEADGANTNSGTGPAPGSSWRDISYAAGMVAASDVVIVEPGVYNESVNLTSAGSAGNYITFVGDLDGDYFARQGEIFMNPAPGQPAFSLNNAHYNAICGFDVETIAGTTGIVSISSSNGYFFDNQVDECAAGIFLNASPSTIIRDNEFDELYDFGVKIVGASSSSVIDNNSIDICFNGIELDGAMTDIKVVWNDINSTTNTGLLVINSAQASVRNNRIADGSGIGVDMAFAAPSDISQNIIFNNSGAGLSVTNATSGVAISNNVFYSNNGGIEIFGSSNCSIQNNILLSNSSSGIYIGPTSTNGLSTDYNCSFSHTMDWDGSAIPGPGSISVAPLFADLTPSNEDFHLQSTVGRFNHQSGWVTDGSDSPCIDAGNPASSFGDEPMPNGGRINMGAYGGTWDASMSAIVPTFATITNLPASGVGAGVAYMNGSLIDDGDGAPVYVSVFWGTADQGQTMGGWDGTNNLGITSVGAVTNFEGAILPNTTYYYRWYATNSFGESWGEPAESFTTTGPPWVDLTNGATSVFTNSATLNANLTADGGQTNNEAWFYWGETDGGTTNAAWSNSVYMGVRNVGSVITNIAGLTPDTTYFYNFYATNSIGSMWAAIPSSNFVTMTLPSFTLNISSFPYGVATPALGSYTNSYGSLLTNSITTPDTRGTTQYVCKGWTMVGNTPMNGNTNLMIMTHTNAASLSWLWATEFDLNVSTVSNGTTDATNGWYTQGTTNIITATPTNGYLFAGWTGDITSTSNPVSVVMGQAYNISPTFTQITNSLDVGTLHGVVNPTFGTSWFSQGSVITATVEDVVYEANTQYVCIGWTGTGSVSPSGGTTNTSFTLTNNSTITWNWTTNYDLSITSDPNGSVDVADGWYAQGTTNIITATPSNGYAFAAWTGDIATASNPVSVVMNQAYSIAPSFTSINYTVTSTAGPGGSISPLGGVSVPWNGTTNFVITPDPQFVVTNVYIDGSPIGPTNGYSFASVVSNHTINALFGPILHTITIDSSSPTSGVNVTVSPLDINTDGNGTTLFNRIYTSSTPVTLTAPLTSPTLSTFIEWRMDGAFYTTNLIANITAATNMTMTAIYSAPQWTITASAGLNGSISPTGAVLVTDGNNQPFTVTPNTNYHVSDLVVNGASVGPTNSYTFLGVTSNQSITASFAPDIGSIRCSITPAASTALGAKWQVAEIPGWHDSNIILNNVPVGPTYTIQFSALAGWNAPGDINNVPVSNGNMTERTGNYTEQGMASIPGGTFTMGIYDGIGGVSVNLSPFQMDVTEVTVADYMLFASDSGFGMPPLPAGWGAWTDDTSRPMCNVKWNEAAGYAAWRGKCLPTEAQYEYAMRDSVNGTNDWRYSYGDDILASQANFNNTAATVPSPVSSKAPTASYGLRDIAGNVWEWTYDWHVPNLPGGNDPSGPTTVQEYKTKRGGAWTNPKENLQSYRRYKARPRVRYRDVGFRCVYPTDGRTPDGDTNNNGVPDWWEMWYFGLAAGGAGGTFNAGADTDGDGTSDGNEYLQGTDPTDPAALFQVSGQHITVPVTGFVLDWPSGANPRFYRIERATATPTGPWSSIVSNIPSAVSPDGYSMAINVHTDVTAAASAWYRIMVNVNPE